MNDNLFPPPAFVRQANDELIAIGKGLADRLLERDRLSLDEAVQLGKILNQLKESTEHGEMEGVYFQIGISQQRASEYCRIGGLTVHDIRKCDSIKDALAMTGKKQSTAGGGLQNHSHSGVAPNPNPARAERVGQKPPTPFPIPDPSAGRSGGGESQGTNDPPAERQEPGDFEKPVRLAGKRILELIKQVANLRSTDPKETGSAIRMAQALTAWLKAVVEAPEAVKPPSEEQCRVCGAAVLWVTTSSGKRMAVDAKPGGGQFELIGGKAVMVESVYGENRKHLYQMHFKTCNKGIQ